MKEKIPAVSSSSSSPQPTTAADAIWLAYWHPLFLFFLLPPPFHPTHICSGRRGRNLLRFPAHKPRRNNSKVAKCVLYSLFFMTFWGRQRLACSFSIVKYLPHLNFPFLHLRNYTISFLPTRELPEKEWKKRSTTPKVFFVGLGHKWVSLSGISLTKPACCIRMCGAV